MEVDQESALVYKNHKFFGQMPKSSYPNVLKLRSFHNALYCCIKHLYIEYQHGIF